MTFNWAAYFIPPAAPRAAYLAEPLKYPGAEFLTGSSMNRLIDSRASVATLNRVSAGTGISSWVSFVEIKVATMSNHASSPVLNCFNIAHLILTCFGSVFIRSWLSDAVS